MKVLGANMIALGIISLMLGLVGLRVGILFFLDEFGPVMGYVLKVGFIVAGVWVWRRDNIAAVEDDEISGESRRAWIPVAVCGAVFIGVIAYVSLDILKEKHIGKQINSAAVPAAWAAGPVSEWPDIVLLQRAKFQHHSDMEAGCASLVRLPTGEVVALTAGHLLGDAGGVSPGFTRKLGGFDRKKLATLTSEIASWKLFVPEADDVSVNVTGLYGRAAEFDEHGDEVLLCVSAGEAGYPTTPLDLRIEPLEVDEPLFVVTFGYDREGALQQVVHRAKRLAAPAFVCELERPVELNGSSGAPVLDKNGLLVGIVTGGTLMELKNTSGRVRTFSGRSVTELLPVIKAAVSTKGIGQRTQIKTAVRPKKHKSVDEETDRVPGNAA